MESDMSTDNHARQTAEAAADRLEARHPGLVRLGPRHLGIAGTAVEFVVFVEEAKGEPHLFVAWLPEPRDPDGTPYHHAEALRLGDDQAANDALLDQIIDVERRQAQADDRTGDHMVKIHRHARRDEQPEEADHE
jgi:hypothetical protein